MVQALIGYSPHKAATGQVMTRRDHNVRTWMENVMATAYGVAPVLSWQLDDIQTPHPYVMVKNAKGILVPKLNKRDMPIANPNYDDELYEFGKALAPRFDELKSRQAFGRRAAHGFNITLELLRRARNINFTNEVSCDPRNKKAGGGRSTRCIKSHLIVLLLIQFRERSPYKRLGLLNGNRFGQYFFDNLPQLATKVVRDFEKPNLEQQAITTGRPVVELERERRSIFADARMLHGPYQQQKPKFNKGQPSK
jgi:hypothetical protein